MTEYKYMNKAYREKIERLDPIAYERFQNGESITSIAKDFKMDRNKLSRRLQEKYGIKVCMDGDKKKINSNYFSILNNENAYWLGLILADGSINVKHNNFELTLKDKEHIELFKKCLQSEHDISPKEIHGEIYYRISFHDKQIINDLISYGILPNKSNIDFHLPTIPDEFFNDFLRGLIDGDGMYYFCVNNHSRFHIRISIGFHSPTYAQELKKRIESFYNVDVHLRKQKTCNEITMYKKSSVQVVRQLYYKNCICLERKYQKCLLFLE